MNKFKELNICLMLPGVGNSKINNDFLCLIAESDSLNAFCDKLISYGYTLDIINKALNAAELVSKSMNYYSNYHAITVLDDIYPIRLKRMNTVKPVVLYTWGDISLLSKSSLAVIGTRHPDLYVNNNAPRVIEYMVRQTSSVLISGLANGCDIIGHNVALESGYPTIAVIPCGFNKLNKTKRKLAERIVASGGLIISEYSPDVAETRYSPVQRDAIVAALSDKLLSLQCGVKSGTMHTIDYAYKYGKAIACYMPSVMEGDFAGHDYAISKYGASPLRRFSDVNEFLTITASNEPEQISMIFD